MATLPRSSDSRVRFTLLGGDGLPVTISGLADMNIFVYQKPKKVIQSWNLDAGEITIITDASGIVEVLLDRANTELMNFQLKDLRGELAAHFTDASFADGVRIEIATDIPLYFATEEVIAVDSQTAYT